MITLQHVILRVLSWLYGIAVWLRNFAFDYGLFLKQRQFKVPVVVIGNIAVGGTGKTPHTEYLISLLLRNYRVGVLSRGYMRQTKGFVLANSHSTPSDIGDEPYQMYRKFYGQIKLAVCEDRCKGIEGLLKDNPEINIIVLDDAFQHRYVKPDISIVLMEFNHMPYEDKMLPLGRLREPMSSLKRASLLVITKTPADVQPLEYHMAKDALEAYPSQGPYFSKYEYSAPRSVFPEDVTYLPDLSSYNEGDLMLVVSGIANPRPFTKYLRQFGAKVKSIRFPDHHNFTRDDLDFIRKRFNEMPGYKKVILTTEKDAVRMAANPYFPQDLKQHIFYIPIHVEFQPFFGKNFDKDFSDLLAEVRVNKSIEECK